MKRVLITGENSYVGTNLIKWLAQYPDQYTTEEISVRGDEWKAKDFSQYDTIVHVAGIAHVSTDPKMEDKYYKVNRDLTLQVAEKAKTEGVNQFVFLSSIIVYGDSVGNDGLITKDTIPNPSNFYGKSKLEAEQGLEILDDDNFKVAIIRPPMIYGKDSKGNYPKLAKLARITPLFPDIDNRRSMLHIDNLSEFLRLMIEHEEQGLFFPQNKEYVKTSEMVKVIAEVHGKKTLLTKVFNPLLKIMIKKTSVISKIFGDLIYYEKMSEYKVEYHIRSFKESISETER